MAINLGVYSINFEVVSERLTPWFWRKPVWLSYLKAALTPLQTANGEMVTFVNAIWTKLSYTGQHLALRELLNDTYDDTLRRIFIDENDVTFDSIDLYKQPETDPSPLSIYLQSEVNPAPFSIYKQGEGTGGDNFTINIPAAITFDEDTLRSLVDFYVIAGKNYNIVIF
jgi:hypothetical protein